MNNEFFERYGDGQPIVIPFSVELNNSFIYDFDFTLKQIENIDNRAMSIIGEMNITRTIGSPASFMSTYSPRNTSEVVLKYDFGAGALKFKKKPKGLVIRPAQGENALNNRRWNQLLLFGLDYIRGKQCYSRL